MSLSKKIARNFILPAAITAGIDKILLAQSNKTCCIINFHGVRTAGGEQLNNRHLPVKEFEKTLKYLKRNFEVVSLQEIFRMHRERITQSRKTVALTFDDGYQNNFDLAIPLLQKYNLPATFFIITRSLTEDNYLAWPDILDILKKRVKEDINVDGIIFKYPTFTSEKLKTDLGTYLKKMGEKTSEIVAELKSKHQGLIEDQCKKTPELLKLVNSEVLKQHAGNRLMEFASHTHDHPCLEYLSPEQQLFQLRHSKQILEQVLQKKVVAHAFPDGSYNSTTLKVSLETGYYNLAAVDYKLNEGNNNANLLSRFTISNSTTHESNMIRLARQFKKYGFN